MTSVSVRRFTVGHARRRSFVIDRWSVLQIVRVLAALAVVVVPAVTGTFDPLVLPVAIALVVVALIAEIVRRRRPSQLDRILSSSVIADGFLLVVAASATGGFASPLLFLVFLDVVAVTLLASYRTGLKLACWCALLLLFAHAAADAGVVGTSPEVSDRLALVSAGTFLLFALATALCSFVTEQRLVEGRRRQESLVSLGTTLERIAGPDDAMHALAIHGRDRVGFARVAVLVANGDVWDGVLATQEGTVALEAEDRAAAVIWETWRSNAPMLVRTLDDALLDVILPDATNVVVVPISTDDEPLGVVAAEWGGDDDTRIPTATVDGIVEAASHTGLALHNTALLRQVEHLATRDALTGVANRRLLEESLERESARAGRLEVPLTAVVVDVDHFKQINDTSGHGVGDAVLRAVAQILEHATKGFDVVARYGGDEFVVLLPGCRAQDAPVVAERLRRAVVDGVAAAPVTVSMGVATMPDDARTGTALVDAADQALYAAKRAGRNCVRAAGVATNDAPLSGRS